MERVQYSLERTLPSLHTLDSTKTFSRDELRALTAQRAALETALVRRIANRDGSDYIAYVAFEDKIEKLRLVRTAKAEAQAHASGRNGSKAQGGGGGVDGVDAPVGGTKEQQARLRAAYLARCISIFERGVTKLKDSLPLWQAYLAWARARNMRIVVGRVFARALNLHTAYIPLWIQAAGYELGTNFAANTARLLLQRAISLNTLPFKEEALASPSDPPAADSPRPKKKKRKQDNKSKSISSSSSSSGAELRPIAFTINLTPGERDLLRLWVEAARMELVFLERLRRRWAILGLHGNSAKTATTTSKNQAQGISQRFVGDQLDAKEKEDSSAEISTAKLANLPGDHAEGLDDEAADDVELSGGQAQQEQDEAAAIGTADVPTISDEPNARHDATLLRTPAQAAQHAIMTGGLLIPLIQTAFRSVAPKLRLALALGFVQLLRSFPLLDESSRGAEGSEAGICASLGAHVLDAFHQSTLVLPPTVDKSAEAPANGAARAIALAARPIWLGAPTPVARWKPRQLAREREENLVLRAQSKLWAVENEQVDGLLSRAQRSFKKAASGEGLLPVPGPGSRVPTDGCAQMIALQLIEALRPLASAPASVRAQLPVLLGQFVSNLFTCAGAAAKAGSNPLESSGSSSALLTAYYGLSLSSAGEEARFGALAAQVLRLLLEARVPARRPKSDADAGRVGKESGVDTAGDDAGDDDASSDENGEHDADADADKGETDGPLLIQETNLRALLDTAIKRFLK
ncbi:hypothetical protein V8E36_003771 [Tilletia maclaganii]